MVAFRRGPIRQNAGVLSFETAEKLFHRTGHSERIGDLFSATRVFIEKTRDFFNVEHHLV